MATDRELGHSQDFKYSPASPFPYQQAMDMSRSSFDSDSSAPCMMHDDQDSDTSMEVNTQEHLSRRVVRGTILSYYDDDDWYLNGNDSDHVTASQMPGSNLSPSTYEVRTQGHLPEMETPPLMVPSSRPTAPSRQRTPRPSREPLYSLFPQLSEPPPRPALPLRSSSSTRVNSSTEASPSWTEVPPVPSLSPMPAHMSVNHEAPFGSIAAVLEAPMPATPRPTALPFRPAPAPPVTPSSADRGIVDTPWTLTMGDRRAGAYQPFTSTTQGPVLRNRSASTTNYPTGSVNGVQEYRQVPATPPRPRTQNSALARPTGDPGQFYSSSSRLHLSASRPNLRPTTPHLKSTSSASYFSAVTPPPTPIEYLATSAGQPPAEDTTDAATPSPNLQSVFDHDSDEEEVVTTGSKIRRFILRPFTGKRPSGSASSTSPHKRSASDGKKSLSGGKRRKAAEEQQMRARGATEGAAGGPFMPSSVRDNEVATREWFTAGAALLPDVGEEKEPERPRLKRKESFARFLGLGPRH